MPYQLLADLVLALHFVVAALVVIYPLLVVCGALCRHPWLAGRGVRIAHGAIRFSLSRYTTDAEIDRALAVLPPIIQRLRAVLPVGM